MPKAKTKTWREKLAADKGLPKVEPLEGKLQQRWGRGTLLIPAPREVDSATRSVPPGKLLTIDAIRGTLARRHGATIACPLTTGIFAWIAAHAAREQAAEGDSQIAPYGARSSRVASSTPGTRAESTT